VTPGETGPDLAARDQVVPSRRRISVGYPGAFDAQADEQYTPTAPAMLGDSTRTAVSEWVAIPRYRHPPPAVHQPTGTQVLQ
jgi:hypothetical protein